MASSYALFLSVVTATLLASILTERSFFVFLSIL